MAAPVPASDDTPAAAPSIPGLPPDWPQVATTKIVETVDKVRTKTAEPAIKISRAVVFGVLAAVCALFMLPMLLIALIRGITVLLDEVYWSYFILGGLFTVIGLVVWSKRPKGMVPRA